jgi:Phosphotransferase enzyme family
MTGESSGQPGTARDDRLLRRVDWRFLLPAPTARRAVSYAGGDLTGGLRLISSEVVSPRGARHCDLAVARDPGPREIGAAFAALDEGGTLCVEWTWRSATTPGRIRRRLRAAGFPDVACYWPWPLTPPHQYFVPLDDGVAIRHFLDLQPSRARLARRLGAGARRQAWRILRAAGLVTPIVSVATRPRSTSSRDRPAPAVPMLAAAATQWVGAADARERPLSLLLRTPGFSVTNTIIGLAFAGGPMPAVLVKTVRRAEWQTSLRAEAEALEQVAHLGVTGGPPHVLGITVVDGLTVLGETYLSGEAVHDLLTERPPEEIAAVAADWLAGFAGRTRSPASSAWTVQRDLALATFETMFGELVDPGLMQVTRRRLSAVGDLPVVFEHRDFAPWNTLLDQTGTLSVLDWESAKRNGMPALDLVYFVTYLALLANRSMAPARARAMYRRTWHEGTGFGPRVLRRYARDLELDPDMLRSLRLLVWPIHAQSEYRRMARLAGTPPSAATLRESLFLALWEEEALAQL